MAQNDVELVIRARNLSTRTVRQFNDELDKIAENQAKVVNANALAERSFESLKAEQNQLLVAMKALSDRSARLGTFERQKQEVDQYERELAQARNALRDLADQFYRTDKPTKAFTDQMARAQRTVDELERKLGRSQKDLNKTGESLRAAGVDTARLSQSQAELNQTLERSLQMYKQAEQNVERYESALQEVRLQQRANQDEEKQTARVQRDAATAAAQAARDNEQRLRKEQQLAEMTTNLYRNLAKAKAEAARAGSDFRARGVSAGAAAGALQAPAVGGAGGIGGAAAGVRALLEPARDAVSTLDKLEAQVKALDDEFNNLTPEVLESAEGMETLANQSRRLREAAAALKTQANLADELNRTNTALVSSQQRFEAARAAVLRYAQEVAQADEPNDQLAASLQRAETELRQAHAELTRNTEAFNKVETQAREAGIEVSQLANVEARLATAARAVTAGQNQVAQTMVRVERATERTTRQFNAFNNSQRTALSLYQRSRGQVLSLVSQYAGLFGAINLANGAVDAAIQREKILSRLRVANSGDTRAAGEDFDYIRQKADELGLVFGPLAESYSRFAVAARDAGQSTEATRYIFEAFTEASAAMRLSSDETAGVFKALEQIFSKGAVQAEELRGQLGDRLTGAFNLFAKAIGVSTEQLDKMLEKGGLVRAEFVLLAAQQARGMYSEEAKNAADSFIGDMAKMQNAWDDLKRAIVDGGFGEQLRSLFQETTKFFKSTDGQQFATNLARVFAGAAQGLRSLVTVLAEQQDWFTKVADAAAFLARNLKTLLGLYAAIEASKLIAFFASLTLQIIAARRATTALNTALAVGTVASASKASGALSAFMAGPVAGLLALAAAGIVIPIYFAYQNAQEAIAQNKAAQQSLTTLDEYQRKLGLLAGAMKHAATTDVETTQARVAQAQQLLAEYDAQKKSLEEAIRTQRKAASERSESINPAASREWRQQLEASQKEGRRFAAEQEAALNAQLADLEAKANTLRAEVAQVETQANAVAAATVTDPIAAEIARLQEQARLAAAALDKGDGDKDAKKRAREAEKLAAERVRLAEETADAIRAIEDDLLKAQDEQVENRIALVKSEFAVRRAEIQTLIEEAKKLGLGDQEAQLQASLARLATLETLTVKQTVQEFNSEKIAANEKEINDLLAARQTELETINLLLEAGLLTQGEASDRIAEVNGRLLPQMDELILKAQEFIATLSGEDAVAAQLALDNIKAKVAAVGAEMSQQKRQVIDVFVQGFGNAFRQTATLIADMLKGIEDSGNAWEKFGDIVLNAIADILIELGQMILMQALFNALKSASENAGGGWGAIISSLASMIGGKSHNGGLIGTGASRPTRVPSYVFANAVEYHSGGIAGLAPDEVPTILQRNEEVLTEDDPRHRYNGGMTPAAAAAPEVTIVNTIESESVVVAGMATRGGRDAVFNVIKANQQTFRKLLGVQ